MENFLLKNRKAFMVLFGNLFFLCIILLFLNKFTSLFIIKFIDSNLLISILIISFLGWLFSFVSKNVKNEQTFKYAFLTITTITLILSFKIDLFKNIPNSYLFFIAIVAICIGLYLIYTNKNKIESKNKIFKKFNIYFFVISILFIAIRIGMPIFYSGSYIDEYNHILSGTELIENGNFLQKTSEESYTRGLYVSVISGLFIFLFGKSIFAVKLIPAILGIINYFLFFKISKSILAEKKYIIFSLFLYTIVPWFIFNHFYIRMFVFYEFFTLFFILLFIDALKRINNGDKIKIHFIISLLLSFIIYFLSDDFGGYLVLLFPLFFYFYILFFKIQEIKYKNKWLNYFAKNIIIKIILTAIFFIFAFIIGDGPSLLYRFISGTIDFSSLNKYDYLFFRLNSAFTILFLISPALLFSKKIDSHIKAIITLSLFLFVIHYNSAPDIQLTRTIIYFLPIFYIIATLSLREINLIYNNGKIASFFVLLCLVSVLNNYQIIFLKEPGISNEVNYIDYKKMSDFIKNKCYNKENIVILHNPYILEYYGVPINSTSYINEGLLSKDEKYFKDDCGEYRTIYGKILTLTTREDVVNKIGGENVCVVIYEENKNYYRYFDKNDFNILENKFKKAQFGTINIVDVFYK